MPLVKWLLLLVLLFPSSARAEEGPPESMSGEKTELVFTYTRQATPKDDVAANITVVTRDDLKKMPASNVAEVLRFVPDVYIELTGGRGSQATASIQGADVRHVAVYQDGVPLNMLANPMTDLSYLPVNAVERIEIYKGAASSVWGSSLGGVINIVTREPDLSKPFQAHLNSSHGDFDTTGNGAAVTGGVGRYGYFASYTHDSSSGFMSHTDYRQDNAYGKINAYPGTSSRLSFAYNYDEGRNSDPTPLLPASRDDIYRRRSYQRILFEASPAEHLSASFEARHQDTFLSLDRIFDDLSVPRGNFFDYTESSLGVSSRMSYVIQDLNTFGVGFDGDWGYYDFTQYATTFHTGNWAFYTNDTLDIGRFSFTGGIRYDDNQDFGSQVSPSVGAVYRIGEGDALIRAQVARGFSAPPGAWLKDPLFGNKDLKAETGINYQLGAETKPWKSVKFELNLFRAEIENLVRFNLHDMRWENVDSVTRQGIEATLRKTFDPGLALSFSASVIDTRDDRTGELLKDVPRILYDAQASYTYKWMTHSILGKYVFLNSSFPETRDRVFVIDYLFKATFPLPDRTLTPGFFFAVHNLTNTAYLYRAAFPQPGRWLEGGVSVDF